MDIRWNLSRRETHDDTNSIGGAQLRMSRVAHPARLLLPPAGRLPHSILPHARLRPFTLVLTMVLPPADVVGSPEYTQSH
jgi:hypothetical protein